MNIREDAAPYYDLQTFPIDDVAFYRDRISSDRTRILELGCGTGRVLLPLARECGFIQASPAMLALCQEKLDRAGLPPDRVALTLADITDFNLETRFDLIIAPFRVLQNLETDVEVQGLMHGIARHLAPGGSAILNAFLPNRSPDEMRRDWCELDEHLNSETVLPNGERIVRWHRQPRLQSDPLVLFPELIYRHYEAGGALKEEAILKIAMRCWYPDELETLVRDSGFRAIAKWGGYHEEAWGEGPELVIEFSLPDTMGKEAALALFRDR